MICLDEKSKQLLEQTRRPIPAAPGQVAKEDYEYKRAGTRNLFVAVEPKAGHREVEVTRRRTKPDFVAFVQYLAQEVYTQARKIHLVLDNLNTHFRASFEEVMGLEAAAVFLSRLEFHYTPKHASWLNMAEIEIGILDRQCTGVALATKRACAPRCSLGNSGAIRSAAGLNGSSADRKPTRNCHATMLRNLCVLMRVNRISIKPSATSWNGAPYLSCAWVPGTTHHPDRRHRASRVHTPTNRATMLTRPLTTKTCSPTELR